MVESRTPAETADFIVRGDRAFGRVVREVGPPPRRRSAPVEQRFASLVRSVTFQLLATRAATTIHARVEDLCQGEVTPNAVLLVGHQRLRDAGLSNAKAAAMLDLATRARAGSLRFDRHGRLDDDAVLTEIVAARGVGPWTAQMYLMHTLARRDVWPVGDFGVRAGWSLVHGLNEPVSESELAREGASLVGERSAVAWYCWRALEQSRRVER
ncbi:MAG TPA: hypothetical protein VMU98_09035 [Acidimicrobiales bacterium]|nr:hypothetical protein [Acidimicrobiales bacterium]